MAWQIKILQMLKMKNDDYRSSLCWLEYQKYIIILNSFKPEYIKSCQQFILISGSKVNNWNLYMKPI